MTICILLSFLASTRGRAPALSCTRRFWIKVESLNRPPIFLTISSSRNSSIIVGSSPILSGQNLANLLDRLVHVVVDDLILVAVGQGQLAIGLGQPPLDGLFGFGAPAAEPAFEFLPRTGPEKDASSRRGTAP